MARTLSEIYSEIKQKRDEYLQLTEFTNGSKMSMLNAFTWVAAAAIYAHESIVQTFEVDLAKDLQTRINGTPAYYVNALLKYQTGDDIVMNDEGTVFGYASIDESKRILTKVSYSEDAVEGFMDKKLILKVAQGQPGSHERISDSELVKVQAYLNKITFAGINAKVVSRKGDILVPRLRVYYDGAVSEDEVFSNISDALSTFIAQAGFDTPIYVQKIIDAIQHAEHVTDVYADTTVTPKQGIYVVQYDDADSLVPVTKDESGNVTSYEQKIERVFVANSGYMRQSTGEGAESSIPKWNQSIILKIEGSNE